MTKRERKTLREAIRLLKTEDGWDAAMDILLPMAGLYSPALEAVKKATTITVDELMARGGPNRAFGADDDA